VTKFATSAGPYHWRASMCLRLGCRRLGRLRVQLSRGRRHARKLGHVQSATVADLPAPWQVKPTCSTGPAASEKVRTQNKLLVVLLGKRIPSTYTWGNTHSCGRARRRRRAPESTRSWPQNYSTRTPPPNRAKMFHQSRLQATRRHPTAPTPPRRAIYDEVRPSPQTQPDWPWRVGGINWVV
jgi:hypothetical protein